jgi:PIN domain nuclease of toxin-antitoxin system
VKLLLDTHIWLWSALDPARLSKRVRATLENRENELWLSPMSVWETLVLAQKKRIILESTPEQWVRRALNDLPVREAPMSHEVAIQSEALRLTHNDPADRFIVATALVYELTLVTADKQLVKGRQVPVLANSRS